MLVSKRTCVLQVAARSINFGSDIPMDLDILISTFSKAGQFLGNADGRLSASTEKELNATHEIFGDVLS